MIITCFGLIMGCSKEETLLDTPGEVNLKKASVAPTFVVEPNGVDDTENLKNAFADAMAAEPGSIVKLVEGEYHINLIEVFEFNGSLKGSGKGKTIITTVADLNVDDFLNQNLQTVLLKFVGGDVCVQDLTIHTPAGPLSTGMQAAIHGQLGFCAITAQYTAENEYINAVVDNVEFISEGYMRNGLLAYSDFFNGIPEGVPLADIDILITNCSFSGGYWWDYGALINEIREGHIAVGTKNNGNIFDNCVLGIWHNVSAKINVQSNTFLSQEKWFGVEILSAPYPELLQQMPQTFQSVCNVENNTFNVSNSTGVMLINDNRRILFPDESPMLVQLKNNKIHTEGNMTVMGCLNLSGAVIRNNKFSGGAEFGLRIFPQVAEIYSDNGLILGNNFSNSDYSITTVLLGQGTRNWSVVGGNLGESTIDEGENNLISGFNNNTSEVPFGQTIVDNLQEMKSPMQDLKNR